MEWIHWLGEVVLVIGDIEITVSEIQAAIILYISRAIRPMRLREIAIAVSIDVLEAENAIA